MMLTPAFDRLPHSAGFAEGRKASQGKQPAVAFPAGAPPEEPQDPATNPISKRLHRARSACLAAPCFPRWRGAAAFSRKGRKGFQGKETAGCVPLGLRRPKRMPQPAPKPSLQ